MVDRIGEARAAALLTGGLGAGVEKSRRFAEQVARESPGSAAAALDTVSSQVVASILAHSNREQASAILDMLNDSGDMTIATACMVTAQLCANVIRRVEASASSSYVAGILRLALAIGSEDAAMTALASAIPAGVA